MKYSDGVIVFNVYRESSGEAVLKVASCLSPEREYYVHSLLGFMEDRIDSAREKKIDEILTDKNRSRISEFLAPSEAGAKLRARFEIWLQLIAEKGIEKFNHGDSDEVDDRSDTKWWRFNFWK